MKKKTSSVGNNLKNAGKERKKQVTWEKT